jgi:hypothetical protein
LSNHGYACTMPLESHTGDEFSDRFHIMIIECVTNVLGMFPNDLWRELLRVRTDIQYALHYCVGCISDVLSVFWSHRIVDKSLHQRNLIVKT